MQEGRLRQLPTSSPVSVPQIFGINESALATDFAPVSTHDGSRGPKVVAPLSSFAWHFVEFLRISLKIAVRDLPMISMHLIFVLSPAWLALPTTRPEFPPIES